MSSLIQATRSEKKTSLKRNSEKCKYRAHVKFVSINSTQYTENERGARIQQSGSFLDWHQTESEKVCLWLATLRTFFYLSADQCHEYMRKSTYILCLRPSVYQGIRELLLAPACPVEKVNSMGKTLSFEMPWPVSDRALRQRGPLTELPPPWARRCKQKVS